MSSVVYSTDILNLIYKLNKLLATIKMFFTNLITINFDFFKNRKSTYKHLFFTLIFIFSLVYILLILIGNNYYTNHSDDVLQYFTITENYFLRFKNLDFSFYNINNFFGASIFSDTYYVPIDLFTGVTFLLAFFINFDFAFSIVEFIKIIAGTMLFAYLLGQKNYSNKSIFVTSMLYMCSGMFVCLMAFPAYLSMIFYLPLGYLVVLKFLNGKQIYLPLYICAIVFYNFYIAYTLIWFICFVFLLEFFLQDDNVVSKKIKKLFTLGIQYSMLLLIGVLLSSVILYPSVMYILNNTERVEASYSLFSFEFTQYLRLVAKIFTPSISTNFYGFENSYILEHFSLNMTVVGFLITLSVFSLKDKASKIFKVVLIIQVLMLLFPITYMILSGDNLPYTRWMVMIVFFNLIIFGHVVTKNNLQINLYSKSYLIIGGLVITGILFSILGYNYYLGLDEVYKADFKLTVEFIYLIIIGCVILLMYLLYRKVNLVKVILVCECICSIVFMFNSAFSAYNKIDYDAARDNLNDYLDLQFEQSDEFYRIFIDNKALVDLSLDTYAVGESLNFNRTNLQNTTLGFFHSFYDKSTNDFTNYIFNSTMNHKQINADLSSLYFNYLFSQQYLVTYNENMIAAAEDSGLVYLDPNIYQKLDNKVESNYDTYELINYQNFIIYDQYITSEELKSSSYYEYKRMKVMLNNAVFDDDIDYLAHNDLSDNIYNIYYNTSKANEELVQIEGELYYEYDISNYNSAMKSYSYFYFDYINVDEIDEVVYFDSSGNKQKCLSNLCFYESPIDNLYVKYSGEVKNEVTPSTSLRITFDNYNLINEFNDQQNELYQNKEISYESGTFHLSYTNLSDTTTVVMIPVSYSEYFKIDRDYELISVNGGFMGVVIPADEVDIDFTLSYYEENFYKGLKLSGLGLVALTAFMGVGMFLKYKKNED